MRDIHNTTDDQPNFRIGNWVKDCETKTIVQIDGLQCSGRIVTHDDTYDDYKRGFKPIGIPLRVDMLDKCGLSNKGGSHSMFWHRMGISFRWRSDGLYFKINSAKYVRMAFVHQLQNLFYTLTGQELPINEEFIKK